MRRKIIHRSVLAGFLLLMIPVTSAVEFCPFCKKQYNKNQIKIEKRQRGVRNFQYVNRCPKCGTILTDI